MAVGTAVSLPYIHISKYVDCLYATTGKNIQPVGRKKVNLLMYQCRCVNKNTFHSSGMYRGIKIKMELGHMNACEYPVKD